MQGATIKIISDAVTIPPLCTAPYSPAIVQTFGSQEFDNDTCVIAFINDSQFGLGDTPRKGQREV
jgi:hypothetical protein